MILVIIYQTLVKFLESIGRVLLRKLIETLLTETQPLCLLIFLDFALDLSAVILFYNLRSMSFKYTFCDAAILSSG